MGLDITAYERVELLWEKPIKEMTDDDWDKLDDDSQLYLYSMEGFEQQRDGLRDGCYRVSGDVFSFRAGSYSGYNAWRDELARFAGWRSARDLWAAGDLDAPLAALIHFPDNEGFIGPQTSARLAATFEAGLDRARRWLDETAGAGALLDDSPAGTPASLGAQAAADVFETLSGKQPAPRKRSRDHWRLPDGTDHWLAKYERWLKAFTLAADTGVVEFH